MKKVIHIIVLISASLLIMSSLSLAQDAYSNAIGANSLNYPMYENGQKNSDGMQENSFGEPNYKKYDGSYSCMKRSFYERFSFSGEVDLLPKFLICLDYSDEYKWVVHDYRVDQCPHIVGMSNVGPIELIRCYYANYYHILGTSLVMSIENPEMIYMNAPFCKNGYDSRPIMHSFK